ncbi:MAG TPA: DUF4381 domain-containing protein [Spongiibacteraceae bacterium]|jgi:hypothetical protein|nr:DUF4381 domain-containing protein [Spongiibacteraceae bacterium]HUH36598.1 DUF4381 domain-containing protein [Spongiibacteraceae bacterium]
MNADPLAGLRDIHLPQAVGWWPPAIGWWLLAALVLSALVAAGWWLARRRARRRYRREAVMALTALHNHCRDQPAVYIAEANALLKRCALAAYPRQQVAALHGAAWLRFLDQQVDGDAFQHGPGRLLTEQAYRPAPEGDIDALHQCVRQWLEHHQC